MQRRPSSTARRAQRGGQKGAPCSSHQTLPPIPPIIKGRRLQSRNAWTRATLGAAGPGSPRPRAPLLDQGRAAITRPTKARAGSSARQTGATTRPPRGGPRPPRSAALRFWGGGAVLGRGRGGVERARWGGRSGARSDECCGRTATSQATAQRGSRGEGAGAARGPSSAAQIARAQPFNRRAARLEHEALRPAQAGALQGVRGLAVVVQQQLVYLLPGWAVLVGLGWVFLGGCCLLERVRMNARKAFCVHLPVLCGLWRKCVSACVCVRPCPSPTAPPPPGPTCRGRASPSTRASRSP
jgi:hypothetical protein